MNAIILMNYGGLTSIDDLKPFYQHIFRGREVSADVLERAKRRYLFQAVPDPLAAVTSRQAKALEKRLQNAGKEVKTYVALKHARPTIEETVKKIINEGAKTIYTFPTSPLYSKTGTRYYQIKVEQVVTEQQANVHVEHISHWHSHPGLIKAICERLNTAIQWISQANREQTVVIFTAHSQPGSPKAHQPYMDSFHELASAIVEKLRLPNWKMAYRSATPGQTWLGPDVLDVITEAKSEGFTGIAVCELLSLTENVEALFDCRYDCQQKAKELDLEFVAAEFLNDADDYIDVLEDIMTTALKNREYK